VHHRVKTVLRRLTDGPGDTAGLANPVNGVCEPAVGDVGGTSPTATLTVNKKRRARSFHNFASDKSRLRGSTHTKLVLDHCGSAIQDDLRADTCDAVEGDAGAWADWESGDCLVVSFSARDFAPQQVRRMAGLLVPAVSAALPLEYAPCSCCQAFIARTI
jgi:hypothetical protein